MADSNAPTSTFGFLVYDVMRLLRENFRTTAPEFGLTLAQGRALLHLSRNEGVSQVALSALLDIQPITLLRHLDRLEKSGLIERRVHPTDRRVQQLYLTPSSQRLLQKMEDMTAQVQDQMMAGLSKAERVALIASLERIKGNLTQMTSPLPADAPRTRTKPRR